MIVNSKIRKGIAINSILLLTGGLLFAGLIGTLSTESPLAAAMLQGVDLIDQNIDYTVDITSDDDLSDLAMFTYQRASRLGCSENEEQLLEFDGGTVNEQNNDDIEKWRNGVPNEASGGPGQKGYPGLQESYLGKFPDCYGAGESNFKGAATVDPGESGEDMEGIYSREKFEIKEPVVLEAGDESSGGGSIVETVSGDGPVEKDRGDTWLEKNFLVASKDSFEKQASKCTSWTGTGGTRQQFAIYFQPEPSDDRAWPWMGDESEGIGDAGPYCNNLETNDVSVRPFMAGSGGTDKSAKVVLCPGDKGYVQMNKWTSLGNPLNDGEAGTVADEARKAGFIQITELGEDCGTALPQIPEDENSIGNIFRLEANLDKGWESLQAADLHKTGQDGKRFHPLNPYTFDGAVDDDEQTRIDPDECALYLREKDLGVDDNGAVFYRQGALIGHMPSDTFPDLDSQAVESSDLLWGRQSLEKDTRHMYGKDAIIETDISLRKVGFTGEPINNDIRFLTSADSQIIFQPYGDMLCTKAKTDDVSRSSNARWVVCDESNYESPTTVEVEHYNGEREYRCSPGSGDWDIN